MYTWKKPRGKNPPPKVPLKARSSLEAFTAETANSFPIGGTKIPQTVRYRQKKKKKINPP